MKPSQLRHVTVLPCVNEQSGLHICFLQHFRFVSKQKCDFIVELRCKKKKNKGALIGSCRYENFILAF